MDYAYLQNSVKTVYLMGVEKTSFLQNRGH